MERLDFSKYPQKPHGGKLVYQIVAEDQKASEIERANELPSIMVDLEAVITIEMITTGVLSPNEGFMNEDDYISVLKEGRLANGVVWPVPLSFAPIGERNKQIISSLSVGDEIALKNEDKEPVALLTIEDIFDYDKEFRASHLFETTDRSHPGVDSIYRRMGDTALGGKLTLLQRVDWGPFEELRLEPKDTWRIFYEEKQFNSAAGFITGANPLHRGHEYIHKNILEDVDGLLLQPLVEMAKKEYTRNEYRILAYKSVLETYYPKDRSMLSPLRVTYIFAGPRETVLHALIMKNYGCTHALIGRDHAGIGDFYDKYASHNIFDQFSAEELGIEIRLFHEVFYCTRCDNLGSIKSCPHDEQYRIQISGTAIREMLRHGMLPPKEVVRPESARIAMQGIQPKGVDENGEATLPVAKTIQSVFPYYTERTRLGGHKRAVPIDPKELTIRDLEAAHMDVRSNANKIYQEVFDEFSYVGDANRSIQSEWLTEARADMKHQQEMVIKDLESKVQVAPEKASDEFMYQDKEEAERELAVAKQILAELPSEIDQESVKKRTWNTLPYHRFHANDDSEK